MHYSESTTDGTSTYWDTVSTTSPFIIYASTSAGWQPVYRHPVPCPIENHDQNEITKEDIDALL